VLVAVAVRLESEGPAIFHQLRLGRDGVPFRFYKFRGMYVDAKERWPELEEHNYSDEELPDLLFHPKHDPRVTRVGRFIRRTSLDELPNLWNVFRGDMSVVGPRPEIPEMIPYYGDAAPIILSVKPGVTSLAKVTGRDELTFSKTLALDLEYVERRSLRLDLKIIFATAATVILQRGVFPG
jgi:lipopolysaccharide/colanic/teichoic acid biosynthesis glycosyltransferase